MKQKTLALCLVLAMLFGMMPTTVFAVDADSPTEISDEAGLKAIANNLSGDYILTQDITLSGTWTPITPFTGTFDGAGHTISGMTVTSGTYAGLFGSIGSSGAVRNLEVEGSINITTSGGVFAGGVVGNNQGTVENCASHVTIDYTEDTDEACSLGGVVGYNSGTVTNCYATGTISVDGDGTNYIGGVVGCNNADTVTACYWLSTLADVGIG